MHTYRVVVEQVVQQRKVVRVHINVADKDEAKAIALAKATETEDNWDTMGCDMPTIITIVEEK